MKVIIAETSRGAAYFLNNCELTDVKRMAIIDTCGAYLAELQSGSESECGIRPPLKEGETHHYYDYKLITRLLYYSAKPIEQSFLIDKTFQEAGAKISARSLYGAYCAYCNDKGTVPMTIKSFGKVVINVTGVEKRQTTCADGNVMCFIGLRFLDE